MTTLSEAQIKSVEALIDHLYDKGEHVKAAQNIKRLLDFYKNEIDESCYRCGRGSNERTLQFICEDCVSEFDERSDEFSASEQTIADLQKKLHETEWSLESCDSRMEDAEAKVKAILCLLDGRAKAQNVILEAAGFKRDQ